MDWINSAVKIFVSKNEDYYCSESFANNALTALVPSIECLLAMKCIALRDDQDVDDIKNLMEKANLKTLDDVLETVLRFFPTRQIPENIIAKISQICGEVDNALSSQQISDSSCPCNR